MTMTLEQIRNKSNPILTNMLLGESQGDLVASTLFPTLPQALRGMSLTTIGNESRKQHDLRRAPGTATKQITFKYESRTFTIDQYAVDLPMPRELIDESNTARRLNVGPYLDISKVAMATIRAVLNLGYELEAGKLATEPNTYPTANKLALSSTTKWSAETGKPITDVFDAKEVVRKATGRRPNLLLLSADAYHATRNNKEVRGMLPSTFTGTPNLNVLKTLFEVDQIVIGDATVVGADDSVTDVWGNSAVLAFTAKTSAGGTVMNMAQPAFGFTSTLPGHPFAEKPWYDESLKSWVYGATYERRVNIATPEAGFLFSNVK